MEGKESGQVGGCVWEVAWRGRKQTHSRTLDLGSNKKVISGELV